MEYLVKINRENRYVRITIPNKIAEAVGLKKYPMASIKITGKDTIEVRGVELHDKEKA